MTKLRERMVEDMNLAGLSAGTRRVYLRAVSLLAERYGRSPDRITEEEVRRYLVELRDDEGVALGTFLPRYHGLRFSIFVRWGGIGGCSRKKSGDATSEAVASCV